MTQQKTYLKGFKNKILLTQYYQNILNSYQPKQLLSEEDFEDVYELLQYHPYVQIKLAEGCEAIKVDWMEWGTKCFHIIKSDGSAIDFSYIQCIKNLKKN